MLFAKVMAAAVSIGALGGASIAVGQNLSAPAMDDASAAFSQVSQRERAACPEVDFRVYFEEGSAALNREAHDTIRAAARDVAGCGAVDVEIGADPSRLANSAERHLSSQRSVAVLAAMRSAGVAGNVFVAPVHDTVVAAERNAGPDFVAIGIAPSQGGQLLSSIPDGPESTSM